MLSYFPLWNGVCDVSILHFWYKCMWKSWLHWHGQTEWITVTYNFYGWFWSIVGHSKTTLMTDIGSKLCFQQKPAHFHNNGHCQSSSCAWWWLLGLQSYMVLMATAAETFVHSFAVWYTGTAVAYRYTLLLPWAVAESDNTGNSYWNLCAVLQYGVLVQLQHTGTLCFLHEQWHKVTILATATETFVQFCSMIQLQHISILCCFHEQWWKVTKARKQNYYLCQMK